MCVSLICMQLQSGFNYGKEGVKVKRIKVKRLKLIKIVRRGMRKVGVMGMKKEPGIDGILVTVGLCIIALLLCVVMKESMGTFINTIVTALTNEAQKILTGMSGMIMP